MTDMVDKCSDPLYRLSIYESGHALMAWALGQRIIHIRMLPRPCETVTEKAFLGNNWGSFCEILEMRVMELFGGQIAEEIVCGATACCTGDIPRIDEITRILGGIYEEEDHEDIFFRLESRTQDVFADERYRQAILPLADLLYARESAGDLEIEGRAVEDVIARFIPKVKSQSKGPLAFLNRLKEAVTG
ncbi:MAG: hypothetical protein H7841_03035 [Magnetospirillum sp. WYHS-4]